MAPSSDAPGEPQPGDLTSIAADELFMAEALLEAQLAAEAGDVPVGAVIVADGRVVARGRNRREVDQDPTAHAEIVAMRTLATERRSWRLLDTTLFVTLEPCPMCAGALVSARVSRLVYAAADPKAGAVDTLFRIGSDERLNHRFEVTAGIHGERASRMLRAFFAARRGAARAG